MAKQPDSQKNQIIAGEDIDPDGENQPLTQSSFKKGEYLVHKVLIEQTRSLQHPKDHDKTVDPLIKIDCFDKTKYSSRKKSTGTATTLWNEHFHFTKSFDDGRAIQNENIKITVLDHKLFGKNGVVGIYELDFTTIYMMDDHVLKHKWLGLINPEVDFNKLTGYIKVSINLVGEGDRQTPLTLENSLKPASGLDASSQQQTLFGDGNLLLPPHIQTKGQQLKITLIKGNHLMKMDTIGTIDPFVQFECGALTIKTEEKSSNENPEWMLNLYLPLMSPSVSEYLIMRIYDYDRGMKDDIVGCQSFKLQDIKGGKYLQPFWENIYGAHKAGDDKIREYLCSHPQLGTVWGGRIKLALAITDCEEPTYKIENITDEKKRAELRQDEATFWDCFMDVYYVLNCPSKDGKYTVKLRWADFEAKTQTQAAQNGVCEFYRTIQIINVNFPYRSSQELPDIYIYLIDDDKPICFQRFTFKEVILTNEHPNGLDKIITLLPDKSIRNKDLDQTGIIKIRIGAQYHSDIQHQAQLQPPKGNYTGKLFVNLFQAQNLVASDIDGTADPRCDVFFYNLKASSNLVNNTLCPLWNWQMQIPVQKYDKDSLPPIILRFFDQDKMSEDFIGQAIINFLDGFKNGQIKINKDNDFALASPKWTDIFIGGQKAGQVLVSFNYFENDPKVNFPAQIAPKVIKHFVKIKALGLRNLKSLGVLPVTKAYIKFDVKSIRRPEDINALARNEIITQPKDSGSNPNIQSIIAFEILLPEDMQYMPSLQCFVHDYVLKGLMQPILGSFTIDLRQFKEKTEKRIKEQLETAQQILFNPSFVLKDDYIYLEKNYGPIQVSLPQQNVEEEEKKDQAVKGNDIQEKRPPRTLEPIQTQQIELIEIKRKNALKTGTSKLIKSLDREIEEEADIEPEYIEVLKQFKILIDGNKLNTEEAIKYVKYRKNDDEGTWDEIEYFPEDYFIGLGYDTQQQKSDNFMIRQQMQLKLEQSQSGQEQKPINQTSLNRLNKEVNEQNKFTIVGLLQNQQVQKEEVKIDVQEQKEVQAQNEFDQVVNKNNPTNALFNCDKEPKSRKHYRLVVPGPLEKSIFMQKETFDTIVIHKGIKNMRNQTSMADIILGDKNKFQTVGKLRGWIDVISQGQLDEFNKHPAAKIVPHILEFKPQKTATTAIEKELLIKSPVVIRVYIIDCFNLPSKDFNSDSDPFISVKLGNQQLDNANEYQENQSNPKFYKMFQITTELPGASELVISVYDYDDFKSNELLGETIIDIEERYFQKRWRQLKNIPIETRQLYHPSSSLSQGVIRLFVEIINMKAATLLKNPWFIDPRPSMNFELRVIIWDAHDVPSKDVEDTSDIYVTGYIDENDKQKTDTHYRSQNGRGSFNWRMKFGLKLPIQEAMISFQIFDKDIFSPDDFISDCTFDFTKLAQKAFENEINIKALGYKKVEDDGILAGSSVELMRRSKKDGPTYEKIELITENVEKAGYKFKPQGRLIISLELVPENMAKKNPVGLGRSEPNHSPFLTAPTGRLQWSWNPVVMMRQLLGPRARLMLFWALFCIFISYFLILMIPMIGGDVIAQIIVGK